MKKLATPFCALLFVALFVEFTASAQPGTISHSQNSGNDSSSVLLRNGNNVLGNTYNVTKCGLNFVQTSHKITSRNLAGGPGTGLPSTFNISGLPTTCRTIEKAYVWFVVSFMAGSPAAPNLTVNNPAGASFTYLAANIGTAPEKCWGEIDTRAFRADVTTSITGNGNYILNTNMPPNGIDGMTLMIIYSDATATYQGSLIIDDGCKSTNAPFLTTIPHTITGFTACGASSAARAFVINSDFQIATHQTTLNGVNLVFPALFYNFDENPLANVVAGQTVANYACSSTDQIDCFSFIMAGLYYQTTSCVTCPAPLTVSITPTHTTCGLNNGAATAVPSTAMYGPYTYAWSPGAMNTATVTNLAPGNYTVTITGAAGCNTATQTVTINGSTASSTSITPSNSTICNGSSTTLTASGPGPFMWSTGAPTASITVSPSSTTSYSVTLTTPPCPASATATVTVTPAPVATFNYPAAAYCQSGVDPSPVFTGGGTAGTFSASPAGLVFVSSSTGVIDLSASSPATYTVFNSFPASGGCPPTSASTTITISAPQNGSFTYPSSSYCQNAANPSASIPGNYSSTAGLVFANTGTGEINLAASTPATYTITNTVAASGGCPVSTYTFVLTIVANQSAAFNYASSTFCFNGPDPTPTITGTPGGTFSSSPVGLSIDPSTGTIDLSSSVLNTYSVTYTVTGACGNSFSINVTITNTPAATFNYAGPYCQAAADPYPTFTGGGSAGTFSASPAGLVFVSNATGQVDLSASTPGTYTVTNTIPASGACLSASDTSTITITATPSSGFSYPGSPYCSSGTDPVATPDGGAITGTFSSTTGAVFVNTSTGEIDLSASPLGSHTIINTIAASASCPSTSSSATLLINAPPSATFSYPASPYCQSATDPFPVVTGTAGVFSSTPGLVFVSTATGEIDLSASTPNTYTVTNTIPASGGCAVTSYESNITISPAQNAGFTYSSTVFCQTAANPSPTITGVPGGSFSTTTPGLVFVSTSTGEINLMASATGNYDITYTTPGPCANTGIFNLFIVSSPSGDFSYPLSPYCSNEADPAAVLDPSATAGTFSSTPGLVFINTSTGEVDLSASTPNTYTVTNTVPPMGGCPGTAATNTITVNPAGNPSFSYSASTYCQSASNPVPVITGTSGGSFTSSPAGLSLNSTTGEIDLAASSANSYTITYNTGGPCPASSSTTISIITAPAADFSYASPYCIGGANAFATLAFGASAGTFSSTPGLAFASTSTGEVNVSMSSPSTYTVTNTIAASGTCPEVSATATITINAPQDASFTYSGSPFCQSASNPLPVFTTGSAGTFSSDASLSINSSTGQINLAASSTGPHTITNTIAASGGCPAVVATFNISIVPAQNASFSYPATSFCQSSANPMATITGAAGGAFSFSPAGLSINPTTGEINLMASTPNTYTITYTTPPCEGSSSVVIVIAPPLTTTATGDVVCENGSIQLIATGGTNYTWTGPGTFGSLLSNPVISPATLANAGTYTVVISNAGCSATETVNVTVNTLPLVSVGADTTITAGESTMLAGLSSGPYSWSPGTALSCTNCPNPIATPSETTTYCLSSTVNGCTSTDCLKINVEFDCPVNKELGVPNAFSPNGDGINDVLCMHGWAYCMNTYNIAIFDRWGEKVYESSDASDCWDGLYKGKRLDPGVFVFFINALSTNNTVIAKTGNISLIR